jgi:hypothetical protein
MLIAIPGGRSFAQTNSRPCPYCEHDFPESHPHLGSVDASSEEQDKYIAKYRNFELQQGHFRYELPTDWAQTRDARDDARIRSHGVYAYCPRVTLPRPAISVRYYTRENALFRGAEHYLIRQLDEGVLKLPGEKTSKPRETKLGDMPATTFTRNTFDYYLPRSLDTQEIPVREECLVAESKEGFFVLRYTSPTASFARWRPAFQHLLDTFQFVP